MGTKCDASTYRVRLSLTRYGDEDARGVADRGADVVEERLDGLLGFRGDLEGHVGRRFGAGALDGGDLETQFDDVVGAVAGELFEADEELLVTELAGHFDASAGGDEFDGGLRVGARFGDVFAFVLARRLFS
ncbi:hypothetical protein AWC03_22455 [Mycobacterium europaeum]|nr:hypothetical protein AWC03_22455 [Mycobacterium europaeum]